MSKEEYIDRAGSFVFDRLSCLRNEYAHNDCTKCMEICPADAFVMVQKKLRLSSEQCISCGVCIGSCPTNSLSLLENDISYAIKKLSIQDNPLLTCENLGACLCKFSSVDFISISLELDKVFTCNLSSCKKCELNCEGNLSSFIENSLDEANSVLKILHVENIEKNYDEIDMQSSRREFFRNLLHVKKQEVDKETFSHRLERLKRDVKPYLTSLTNTQVEEALSFSFSKSIDNSCTNCSDCISFCPTGALSHSSDTSKIYFQMGKCIGCNICEDICKTNSVSTSHIKFDLVNFAYNRAEVLISHDIKICSVCKCGFSYKAGEVICDRCASFEKEHSDIFTLACEK